MKVFEREAFFIRKEDIKGREARQELIDAYTFRFYEEKACDKCEYQPERHVEGVCDNCAAYQGGARLAENVKINEKAYIRFPVGDRKGLVRNLRRAGVLTDVQLPTWINRHPDHEVTRFKRPIKFNGTWRGPYQKEAHDAFIAAKKGVIKAPPRSGKTVIGSAITCTLGLKTLIVTVQAEWLKGFYETFCGSASQPALTNAIGSGVTAAERRAFWKSGKKRASVGFCKTLEDFQRHDVCLATVQSLYSENGLRLLKKLKNMFSVVIVDEVHTSAAPKFSQVLAALNAEYILGLSGTPTRKDQRHAIMHQLIGPIVFKAEVERLKPTVRLVRTDYVDHNKKAQWVNMVTKLENDKKRIKLIAQWAIKDVEQGHMVIIPLTRVKAIDKIVEQINKLAGKKLAHPFYGNVKGEERENLIQAARSYKVKILVGGAKLVSTGVNIPRASAIYDVAMSSNLENCEQRVSRVLTPYEDKPPPMLRIFLDDTNARRACLRNEWWGCIWKVFKPTISNPDLVTLKAYLSGKSASKAKELSIEL